MPLFAHSLRRLLLQECSKCSIRISISLKACTPRAGVIADLVGTSSIGYKHILIAVSQLSQNIPDATRIGLLSGECA